MKIIYSILILFYLSITLSNGQSAKTNKFIYSPKESEYEITFSSIPEIISIVVPNNGPFTSGEQTTLELYDGSAHKVEFLQIDTSFLYLINKDFIVNFLNEYSKTNGLSFPTITYKENLTEKIGELTSFKSLNEENGEEIPITVNVKMHIKDLTIFVVTVISKSKSFPTYQTSIFWESFKLKTSPYFDNNKREFAKEKNGWSVENSNKLKLLFMNMLDEPKSAKEKEINEFISDCALNNIIKTIAYKDFISNKELANKLCLKILARCRN